MWDRLHVACELTCWAAVIGACGIWAVQHGTGVTMGGRTLDALGWVAQASLIAICVGAAVRAWVALQRRRHAELANHQHRRGNP